MTQQTSNRTRLILIQGKSLATYVGPKQKAVYQMGEDPNQEVVDHLFNTPDCWKTIKKVT